MPYLLIDHAAFVDPAIARLDPELRWAWLKLSARFATSGSTKGRMTSQLAREWVGGTDQDARNALLALASERLVRLEPHEPEEGSTWNVDVRLLKHVGSIGAGRSPAQDAAARSRQLMLDPDASAMGDRFDPALLRAVDPDHFPGDFPILPVKLYSTLWVELRSVLRPSQVFVDGDGMTHDYPGWLTVVGFLVNKLPAMRERAKSTPPRYSSMLRQWWGRMRNGVARGDRRALAELDDAAISASVIFTHEIVLNFRRRDGAERLKDQNAKRRG